MYERRTRTAHLLSLRPQLWKLTVRQGLAQALNTLGGDLRAAEVQRGEASQPFEMLKPSVGDLRADEIQPFKVSQRFEMFKPGVGDSSRIAVKCFQVNQPLKTFKPSIGDLCGVEK